MHKYGICIKLLYNTVYVYASVNAANDYALSVSTCFFLHIMWIHGGGARGTTCSTNFKSKKITKHKNISQEDVIRESTKNHVLNSESQKTQ